MPERSAAKTHRIEIRATEEEKRLLLAAAGQERLDLTAFLLRAALPAARAVIERARRVELSDKDTVRVLELLDDPPEPTPALRAAARRFRAQ